MKNLALTVVVVLITLIVSTPLAIADGPDAVTVSTPITPDQQDWLDSSVQLFADNGLALPNLEVFFFDDRSGCGGHEGTYRPGTEPAQIRICSEKPFVLPHELAHVWEDSQVSDETRALYMIERELETWNDHGYEWNKRGVEDAAFVVQQNLTMTKVRTSSRTWQERISAYELLTGQTSPLRGE